MLQKGENPYLHKNEAERVKIPICRNWQKGLIYIGVATSTLTHRL